MTEPSIIKNVEDPLRLHLSQKYVKCGKKWQSYGQFTKGRLRDSSEYHIGRSRSIGALFEQKRNIIWQKMAELWLIYQEDVVRLRDLNEYTEK